jgi:polysaccharide export outer membrane protein
MRKTVTTTSVLLTILFMATVHSSVNGQTDRRGASAKMQAMRFAGWSSKSEPIGQACPPASNAGQRTYLNGVDGTCLPREPRWKDAHPILFQPLLHGEYIGPIRQPHVDQYRLRVGDSLQLVYRYTREIIPSAYRINVGDLLEIQSIEQVEKDKEESMVVQALVLQDGTIYMPLIESVAAAGLTISELNSELVKAYQGRFLVQPAFMIRPIQADSRLSELRAAVDRRAGVGGQGLTVSVAPDGTVQVVGLGDVIAQGLTKNELKREINARYVQDQFLGLDVEPILVTPAPRNAYVLGQVATPGAITLNKPITVLQAIALAGGDLQGGNLRQIVVMRRTENWQLIATKLDLRGAVLGKRLNPADDIWVRDSDIILVPKHPIQVADEIINMVFTQGIYGVLPNQGVSFAFSKASTL